MKYFYTLLLVHIASIASAHSFISGRVADAQSNHSVNSAVVQLMPGGRVTYTNELGQFRFGGLAGGEYSIIVSMLGFQPAGRTVTVAENAGVDVAFSLSEKAVSMSEVLVRPAPNLGASTISGVDLKLRPVNTTQDLMRLVPGLFIAQHAGGGKAEQIFLRGFDVDHGTDVAVSVDGMPVNMPSHAHGQGYADLHFVIPELVDNLSFSKGCYDVKNGDFNTAGAVRFKTANYLPRSFGKIEGGQFGYLRGVTGINLLGGGLDSATRRRQSAYVAAEFFNSDGYFQSSQNFKRINVMGKYFLAISPTSALTVTLSHFTSKWDASGQIPTRAVEAGLIGRFGSIDNTEGGNTSRQNLNIQLTQNLGRGVLRNQMFYSHYKFNLYSNFTFYLEDSVKGDQINQFETRDIYGYNGSYAVTHELGEMDFITTAGIGLRDDGIGPIGLAHTRRRQFLNDVRKGAVDETNAFAYIEEAVAITPRLRVALGLRMDAFRFRYTSALTDTPGTPVAKAIASPKLNVSYNFTDGVQAYVSAGTGYHSNDARVVTQARNQRTLPRATGVDVGMNVKIGKSLFVNAAVWGLDLENEFVYVGDAGIVEVSGYSRRVGADFSARLQLTPWLFADADVNVTRPRSINEPEGARYIPLAPTFTTIGGISVKNLKGFSGSLRYRYLGNRPANEDNTIVAKGYFIADMVVNYSLGNYTISLSGENLLNRQWNEAQFATESRLKNEAHPVEEIHFTPGTPRFVKAGVTAYF